MTLIKVEPLEGNSSGSHQDVAQVAKVVDGVFRPVSIYLRLAGFYLGNHKNRCFKFLEIFNCAFTKITVVLNVARYSTIFLTDNRFGGSLMASISLFLFFCCVAVLSLVLHSPICKYYKQFVDDLKLYITEYSNSNYLSKTQPRVRAVVLCGVIVNFLYPIAMSEGIQTIFPSLKRHLTPFHNITGTSYVLIKALYAFVLLPVGITLFSPFVLFVIMTYCLKKEFYFYNVAFKEDLKKGDKQFEEKFDSNRKRHEKLCELTETANRIQCHFTAVVYFFGIPVVCCLLYGVIKGSLPIDDVIFNSVNLVTVVFYMNVVTGMASTLNLWAHEPLHHIFRANWSLFTEGTLQKITLFVSRLSSEKIGYSVYGLFTIERSTILMVGGTILTYAVVVLQFQPTSDTCHPMANSNFTHLCRLCEQLL